MSVDTAATQDVQRPKFGSGFQPPSIGADLQRYAKALPSLVCIAANTILLDLGLGPPLPRTGIRPRESRRRESTTLFLENTLLKPLPGDGKLHEL